jgi:hypothetical protein
VLSSSYFTVKIYKELFFTVNITNFITQIKSRRIRWAGHVVRMGGERKVYKVLVGKPEGKKPLGRKGVDGKMGSE